MTVSTHVLDASLGRPAADVPIALHRRGAGGTWLELDTGTTDPDGRFRADDALDLPEGVYRIDFDTGRYFAKTGRRAFYPSVSVTFEVVDAAAHHHVPLLLSPFAYSTYRGS